MYHISELSQFVDMNIIMEPLKLFRLYTKRCRPVWTITWRDSVAPSLRSGVPAVRVEDTNFNKQCALDYIDNVGMAALSTIVTTISQYLSQKHPDILTFRVKAAGYVHKVHTLEWQAMSYFLAVVTFVMMTKKS